MLLFGDPGGAVYGSAGTSNANLLAYWTGVASGPTVQATAGRGGRPCLRLPNNNAGVLTRTLAPGRATGGIALAFRFNDSLPSSDTRVAGLTDGGSNQLDFRVTSGGLLRVTRNGTTLATSTNVVQANVFYHAELKATIHNTAGAYELRLNGAAWVGPATGANTRATANSQFDGVAVGGQSNFFAAAGGSISLDVMDIVAWDDAATDANGYPAVHDFVGDCALLWLPPAGAGAATQWTPDSGANYARVQDATPDGDSSYVESATVGDADTYALSDLPAAVAAVRGVMSVHYARKTDAGSRGMKSRLRSGGAATDHAAEVTLADGYAYYLRAWGQDPNGGSPAAWTVAAVNALEPGQVVSS